MSESHLLEGETGERACLQMYMYKQKQITNVHVQVYTFSCMHASARVI